MSEIVYLHVQVFVVIEYHNQPPSQKLRGAWRGNMVKLNKEGIRTLTLRYVVPGIGLVWGVILRLLSVFSHMKDKVPIN